MTSEPWSNISLLRNSFKRVPSADASVISCSDHYRILFRPVKGAVMSGQLSSKHEAWNAGMFEGLLYESVYIF